MFIQSVFFLSILSMGWRMIRKVFENGVNDRWKTSGETLEKRRNEYGEREQMPNQFQDCEPLRATSRSYRKKARNGE